MTTKTRSLNEITREALAARAARRYTTRRDAEQATHDHLPDASPDLLYLVSDKAWRQQVDVETATRAVEAAGVDCEGY